MVLPGSPIRLEANLDGNVVTLRVRNLSRLPVIPTVATVIHLGRKEVLKTKTVAIKPKSSYTIRYRLKLTGSKIHKVSATITGDPLGISRLATWQWP